jgi:transglutaminase-like putative cysteine protease
MATTKQDAARPEDHRPMRSTIVILIVAGLMLTAWRYAVEPEEAAAPGDRLWAVELSIRASAVAGKTSVEIAAPLNTRFLRVVGQNISHPAWRQSFSQQKGAEPVRRIAFVASKDGNLSIHAVFSVHASATPRLVGESIGKPLAVEAREAFLADHPVLQIEHPEVVRFAAQLAANTDEKGSLPDAIYDKVRLLRERANEGLLEVPEILAGRRANARERAYTMVALCRAARIPARLVKGLVLRESAAASLHFWVEVYQSGRWQPFDPAFGYREVLPPNYLPFVKGVREVVGFSATSDYGVEYSIINADPLLDLPESTHGDWREVLDLTRLPLDTRIMLAALMLLPFGALLTAVFNEVIGIRSFGVFTPTLLALSLVYVPWQSAAVVLAVVLLLGVGGRAVIPGELSRVPRLSLVLTLVALGIGMSASFMDYFDIVMGGQLVLLPIVILASLVDRFYSLLDEKGLHTAIFRLAWTLLLAVFCIPIIRYEELGHALIRYPELHLVTLAVILALTLYKRKRLSQLPGFSWLDWAERPKPKI